MSTPLLDVVDLGVVFERSTWPRQSILRAVHEVTFSVAARAFRLVLINLGSVCVTWPAPPQRRC